MSKIFFNSSADDPYDSYAHTGKRQKAFANALNDFLVSADAMSDRYSIESKENLEGNPFYVVRFFDESGGTKASIYLGVQPSKTMDISTIAIDLVRPDLPKDNSIYFVDARDIMLKIAKKYDVDCVNRQAGHFEIGARKFFSDVGGQLRQFLMAVEKAIRIEPNSINNKNRIKPQPRIPMQ